MIASLFLIITNWPSISAVVFQEPEPFFIDGCSVGNIRIEIIEAIVNEYVGVPDYQATLYFQPINDKVLLENHAELSLEIVDEGILKLNESYFHILLYDPDNKLRAAFPCFCNGEPTGLGVDGRCQYSGGQTYCYFRSGDNPKFPEWSGRANKWEKNGEPWKCNNEKYVCISDQCINPQTLASGKKDDRKILYRFKVDKVGDWKAFAFLYEKKYKIRDDYSINPFSIHDIEERAIAYTETEFKVVNEKPQEKETTGFAFRQVALIIIAFLGYLGSVIWLYEPIRKFFTIHKRRILEIIILLIIVAIVSRFFCVLGCPIN